MLQAAFRRSVFHRHRESLEIMDPDRLKTIPLFSSLSDQALKTLSVFSSETSVSAGKRLVHEGDYSYELIVIETGTADVIKGGEVIGSLGPGDVFGEMGMLSGGKRTADVVATSPMHLITLSKWDLKRISAEINDQLRALVEQRQELDEERA
jgi:CRP/FNR family transcriptional regulator, cyclic AMP receptor protein